LEGGPRIPRVCSRRLGRHPLRRSAEDAAAITLRHLPGVRDLRTRRRGGAPMFETRPPGGTPQNWWPREGPTPSMSAGRRGDRQAGFTGYGHSARRRRRTQCRAAAAAASSQVVDVPVHRTRRLASTILSAREARSSPKGRAGLHRDGLGRWLAGRPNCLPSTSGPTPNTASPQVIFRAKKTASMPHGANVLSVDWRGSNPGRQTGKERGSSPRPARVPSQEGGGDPAQAGTAASEDGRGGRRRTGQS